MKNGAISAVVIVARLFVLSELISMNAHSWKAEAELMAATRDEVSNNCGR